jgi:hypothetical protein
MAVGLLILAGGQAEIPVVAAWGHGLVDDDLE